MIFERGPQIFLTIDLSHFPFKKLLFYQENSTNSLAKGMTDRFCTVVGIAKFCPKMYHIQMPWWQELTYDLKEAKTLFSHRSYRVSHIELCFMNWL